jgi:acyl-CoA thioester hydrolase
VESGTTTQRLGGHAVSFESTFRALTARGGCRHLGCVVQGGFMRFLQSHVYRDRVQFENVDLGGYVHHPNYLLFLERGRYSALCDIEFGFEGQMRAGRTFVVAETQTRYMRPLSMGQEFFVVTRTVACRRSSLKVVQIITLELPSPEVLLSVGDNLSALPGVVFDAQIRFVLVDLASMKAAELSEFERERLVIPGEGFFVEQPQRRDVRLHPW